LRRGLGLHLQAVSLDDDGRLLAVINNVVYTEKGARP